MKRIPEPDLMDDVVQAKAYAEADFSEPHEAFVNHFKLRYPDFMSGEVLDLGCGTCDVIMRFARVFPQATILGVDGARAMLDIGMQEVNRKGLVRRIKLKKCKLPCPELSGMRFDAVISNSLLHHLADPLVLWHTVSKYAKPDAPIFIMDLLRPNTVELAKGFVQQYAADAAPDLQNDYYNSLLAAYRVEEIRQQLDITGFRYLNVEVVSDRHVLIWGKNRE
ncbi:MAG: class I SAM-dependent methyltransferase [Nitrospiraceae bacterium]|nr:MAG: class I SAM-dependent methyltransferase [Nitrospiraceae bacterium]